MHAIINAHSATQNLSTRKLTRPTYMSILFLNVIHKSINRSSQHSFLYQSDQFFTITYLYNEHNQPPADQYTIYLDLHTNTHTHTIRIQLLSYRVQVFQSLGFSVLNISTLQLLFVSPLGILIFITKWRYPENGHTKKQQQQKQAVVFQCLLL